MGAVKVKYFNLIFLTLILFSEIGLSDGGWISSGFSNGGWISSGGESLIYARNPWFVKNTSTVEYCLQMDESSFSVSKSEAEKIIVDAFKYWKSEFELNTNTLPSSVGFAKVATQDFIYTQSCTEQTPLIFKFGLKTLNSEEIAYLNDPKKYIGVTVRKSYDLATLRGSGIIYISADLGSDAYSNNGLLINEAWKNPNLLRYALIHELGHFFGIPHVGSGIMSEIFMTILLNHRLSRDFTDISQFSFLNPQRNFEVCQPNSSFNPDFFLVKKNTTCLEFRSVSDKKMQWEVFSKTQMNEKYESIGMLQVNSVDQTPYSLKPAIIVQLPDKQSVFTASETLLGPFMIGAIFSDVSYIGSFQPKNSVRSYALQMSLSAEKISLVGTVNNQQMTVMNYVPLSFMKAIFP